MCPHRAGPLYYVLALAAALFCAALLMPSDRSLWTDEGYSAMNARPDRLRDWCQEFKSETMYDPLKPLHGFSVWIFSKVTGDSEIALRRQNWVWLTMGVVALGWMGWRTRLTVLPYLFLAHPFVWYYMDEVRPYAMQLGSGALLVASGYGLLASEGRSRLAWLSITIGALILSGSSMLGGFISAFSLFVGVVVFIWKRWKVPRFGWVTLLFYLLSQGLWLVYYIWRLSGLESGGAKQWSVGWMNSAYAMYEMLGLGAFGPEREFLRETLKNKGLDAGLKLFETPVFFLGGALLLVSWLAALVILWRGVRKGRVGVNGVMGWGGCSLLLLASLALVGCSWWVGWPFWGRHLAGLLPLGLALLAAGWLAPGGRWALLVLSGSLLLGSIQMRFVHSSAREDHRTAARLALDTYGQGEVVWWLAVRHTATYYGLPLGEYDKKFICGPNNVRNFMRANPAIRPRLVVLNRPDINDPEGEITAWLLKEGYESDKKVNGFTIYRKPSPP